MKPLIGIITCGTENDRQFVSQPYIYAVERSGGVPLLIPSVRSEALCPLYSSICEGYLFCGGGDITPLLFGEDSLDASGQTDHLTDCFQISLMKYILASPKPVLAICRGMQILNVALGGTIYQDLSLREKPSLHHMQNSRQRQDISHRVFFSKGSLLRSLFGPSLCTNSFHHQAVHSPGSHLTVSGKTKDGVIESVESAIHPFVIGVQWHPECMFDASQRMRLLFAAFLDAARIFRT